jgi:PKD repeat protein
LQNPTFTIGDLGYSINNQTGGFPDPTETITFINLGSSTKYAEIAVQKYAGVSKTLELYIMGNGNDVAPWNIVASDSIFGHPAVPDVIAVAAIPASSPSTIEPSSSRGPVTISYPSAVSRSKPDISGVDCVAVTGVGGFGSPFCGTSASAPHIAAIAAQIWGAYPTLTPAQVRSALYSFAVDLGSAGKDTTFGYGRADALAMVNFTAVPVANFTAIPQSGNVPLSVQFTDTSSNSPTGWAWYFGDETYAAPWTQVTASAGWSPRYLQTSVVMPDGSIVLMGGADGIFKNDVWRSTNNGTTWTQVSASAGWSPRGYHSSVVMPDGSIVLMGGGTYSSWTNDTWRSTDKGATWTQMNASAGWSARNGLSSVAMPDGSIVLMGGGSNDVWRSIDNGATWTLVNASAGWSPRSGQSSVLMPDGSIVLMGGQSSTQKNDVWRSTNNGTTWTLMNASAGWSPRSFFPGVVMPDGSIVLLGGTNGAYPYYNDVWRSTDEGATWTQVSASAGWSGRIPSSVVMPDGSIVLMGGWDGSDKNDVWRFISVGSSAQNPSHTYTKLGTYQVALQAYNAGGYNSNQKVGYITVNPPGTATVGIYRNGVFYLRNSNTGGIADATFGYGNLARDSPVVGDWNGDGIDTVGVYRNGVFYLRNSNTNGIADLAFFYGQSGDIPLVGDWNGDSVDTIGMYRNGVFYLRNSNTNGIADLAFTYGQPGDVPVIGDWTGIGIDTVGVYRNGVFYLRNSNTGGIADITFGYGNLVGDFPVVGDWTGSGKDTIGVYRNGVFYLRNSNTNGIADLTFTYGQAGDVPVIGDWNGT